MWAKNQLQSAKRPTRNTRRIRVLIEVANQLLLESDLDVASRARNCFLLFVNVTAINNGRALWFLDMCWYILRLDLSLTIFLFILCAWKYKKKQQFVEYETYNIGGSAVVTNAFRKVYTSTQSFFSFQRSRFRHRTLRAFTKTVT